MVNTFLTERTLNITMGQTQFLNIDLDIESSTDVHLIIEEFGDRVSVMRSEEQSGIHYASFETGKSEINEIVEEYVSLVNGLSSKARAIWDNCAKRLFDIGYESGQAPHSFHSRLSEKSIRLLSSINASVDVTIYSPSENN